MSIQLSDHFTYGRLLRFTLPSIVMMIITSIYSVVDGLFVSNLVGENALSAVNIIFPLSMIVGAFGFMLGTGGSAVVARTLGEGKPDLANHYFSTLITATVLLGAVLSALISFLRSLLLRGGIVLPLPLLWGLDGIWLAVTFAELLAAVTSATLLITNHSRYHYY